MECSSCYVPFLKKRVGDGDNIIMEKYECDLCNLKTCQNCISIIHDDFGIPFLVCGYCLKNVDTYIADRFEDYLEECNNENLVPLKFSVWLKLPCQNDLRTIRKESRKQTRFNEENMFTNVVKI